MVSAEKKERDESACHWMPCSVDYDGLAPVQMYFRPESVALKDEEMKSKNQTELEQGHSNCMDEPAGQQPSVEAESYSHMAASFRGRGLLARSIHELPESVIGGVFTQSQTDSRKIQKGESFNKVIEWEHECDKQRILPQPNSLEDRKIQSESSVEKGLALVELLRCVHDPIPIEA